MNTVTFRASCSLCPWRLRGDVEGLVLDALHAHVARIHRRAS